MLLKDPIRAIKLFATSVEKKAFDFAFDIQLDYKYYYGKMEDIGDLMENIGLYLSGDGEELDERGGNYIITRDNGMKFIISLDDEEYCISITTGDVILSAIEEENGEEPVRLLNSPLLTKENYDIYLSEFINLSKEAIGVCYKNSDIQKQWCDPILLLEPKEYRDIYSLYSTDRNSVLKNVEILDNFDLSIDSIGGQKELKQALERYSLGFKSPEIYRKWGTKFPRGILLYGPPGTGKTLMAKVLSSVSESRFFSVRWADIASEWYGESEATLKDIFEEARKGDRRTVIFFDEIDALAPNRSHAHEASQKVVATLLGEMDGMKDSSNILVVGATNRLEGVDSALKRGGRFDLMIKVDLPDDEGKREIFDIHLKQACKNAERSIFDTLEWSEIVKHMDKFSGADIAEVIRRTLESKVDLELRGKQPGLVTTEDILVGIREYRKRNDKSSGSIGFVKN